ncbi:MAG: class I tRNA ligase family protein, partial [Agromyces sp.]
WLISRQRFFGVPIPIWYPIDANGDVNYDSPIVPTREQLPVDPSTDVPNGYDESQRGQAGGFIGEVDIMDTWATSSLTPQLAAGWERDPELFDLIFPYSLRPQGQDIIRTWLFSTLLRSELEHSQLPWSHAALSGFIVDPDRKKMSKSKGNVVTPAALLEQHGSDAVRYWAASSKLGADAAFNEQDPTQIKIGRRLAIKLLNAAKFAYGFGGSEGSLADVTETLDRSMLASLANVIDQATNAYDNYDHARALELTESFFWTFCDDYLELVKERAHAADGSASRSAAVALHLALDALVRLFAPVLPFATEEVWSWLNEGSVHLASWPEAEPFVGLADPQVLAAASASLIGVRRAKTEAKASQKTPVARAVLTVPSQFVGVTDAIADDLRAVGRIGELEWREGDEFGVLEIELAETE